ncbi:hypothetical protein Tdes44962_MAKER09716 [Teratosphaeria destructans]|uniref:Uncharacterized protein n=1 Tax=Teratosphaeria destructans TaxID=418781 RepID=A0A9W7SRL4_9PEZI|nr:hypothetical protein Tdes44962_MAKER09716 [Teratosphaeria destructans]
MSVTTHAASQANTQSTESLVDESKNLGRSCRCCKAYLIKKVTKKANVDETKEKVCDPAPSAA